MLLALLCAALSPLLLDCATSQLAHHTDSVPAFDLTVNQSSKSITVTVEPGDKVKARLCYKSKMACLSDSTPIIINPLESRSATLNLTYLLPCVCVQVYYTFEDARRHVKCPFKSKGLMDIQDVWRSSEVTQYESGLEWIAECPASDFNISASLCWMQRQHLCTPVLNSTLEKEEGPPLKFNTPAVDRHPQMCVQFSLRGSHNINCPFKEDTPSWEVFIRPGRQSISVYLTSSASAAFSAQLCVLSERGCTPIGPVHSATMEGNSTETKINVPLHFHFVAERPCVQVWQSDPALQGKRILCPDYMHQRKGIYAVAALVVVAGAALLGIFIHRVTKRGASGILNFQRPLLLVCSSDQSAHVSAVCALASILQEELGATVYTSLWAQSSQMQAQTGSSVADLGPLPWLYGQWETVCKAQGKVLIIWSPEAKKTYEMWREERANMDKDKKEVEDHRRAAVRQEKIGEEEEDLKRSGRKCKKEKAVEKKACVKLCNENDWCPQKVPSLVIEPVFKAALACLEGALQKCKGQGVAIVNFQGLGHNRDVPKALRGVPRYCLPQDFRGLIQELGRVRRQTKTGKFRWHCCPRLLSKVLSIWLARQLAQRLQALLPQTQGLSVTSTKITSRKTQSTVKLPPAARPATEPVQEPLHGSAWTVEEL